MLNVRTLLQNMYHQTRQAAVLTGYRIQLLEYLVHNKITSNNNIQRLQWHIDRYSITIVQLNNFLDRYVGVRSQFQKYSRGLTTSTSDRNIYDIC